MTPTPTTWPAIFLAVLALMCLVGCLAVFGHGLLARRQAGRAKARAPVPTTKAQTGSR